MNNKLSTLIHDVLSQATKGIVKIKPQDYGFWIYFPRFYSKIEGKNSAKTNGKYPILDIPDFKLFVNKIENYLNFARKFYKDDKDYFNLNDDEFDKKLFLDLIVNATNIDFAMIYDYIDERTNMLKNPISSDEKLIGELNGFQIYRKITKNRSNIESPYCYNIYIKDSENLFLLPSILFGFGKDKATIMGIQNFGKIKDNPLSKKLDRYFRKLNKNVPEDDIISQVSPNALAALTFFIKDLKENDIKNIKTASFHPVRYHASKVSLLNKNNKENIKKLNQDQHNMTEKFLYTILRYAYHFDNCILNFNNITQEFSIKLEDKNATEKDNIIYSLDKAIFEQNKDFEIEK